MKLLRKLLVIVNGEEKAKEMMSRIYLRKSANIMRGKITEVSAKDLFSVIQKEIDFDDPLFDTYCVTQFILDVQSLDKQMLRNYMNRYHFVFRSLFYDLKRGKKKKLLDNPMFLVDLQKNLSKPYGEILDYSLKKHINPKLIRVSAAA